MQTPNQSISVIKTGPHPLHFYNYRISLSDLSAALHETLEKRNIRNLQSILPEKGIEVYIDAGVKDVKLPHEIHDEFLDLGDAKKICREFWRFDIEAEIINWQVAMNPEVQTAPVSIQIQTLKNKYGVGTVPFNTSTPHPPLTLNISSTLLYQDTN